MALGPDLITDGSFSIDPGNNWDSTNCDFTGAVATFTLLNEETGTLVQAIDVTAGKSYQVTIYVVSQSSNQHYTISDSLGGGFSYISSPLVAEQTYTYTAVCGSSNQNFSLTIDSISNDCELVLDDITVKEIIVGAVAPVISHYYEGY